MVKIGNILKRSWQILWNYKVLWIFGLLLAVTTGGRGGGNGGGSSSSRSNSSGDFNGFKGFRGGELPADSPQWMKDIALWFKGTVVPMFTHPDQYIGTFVIIGLVILLIIIVCGLLSSLVRYPSETAVIRMVDEYETTGTKVGFKAGWKMGWNIRAFRLWLIDLILCAPVLLLVLMLGGAAAVIMASSIGGGSPSVIGMVGGIGLVFVAVMLLIVAAVILGVLRNFFARAAVLEGVGVGESFRQGWAMFKHNWKSAGLVWLVMVGIGIVFGIASVIAFVLLIPVFLLLILPAGVVAAIPGLIAYAIASLFTVAPWTWIIAALVALPFFGFIAGSPFNLIEGLFEVYESNVWTLTYREIKALESISPVEVTPVAVEPPAL
jgi:hypothetical protein